MPTFILGADHAGFALKEHLRKVLDQLNVRYEDLSPKIVEGDDYPFIAKRVAKLVAEKGDVHGLLVCGTGFGMDIAANRFRGVRAVVAQTAAEARLAREHNHANILVLGGHITEPAVASHILKTWIDAHPSYAQRHVRRIHQIDSDV